MTWFRPTNHLNTTRIVHTSVRYPACDTHRASETAGTHRAARDHGKVSATFVGRSVSCKTRIRARYLESSVLKTEGSSLPTKAERHAGTASFRY